LALQHENDKNEIDKCCRVKVKRNDNTHYFDYKIVYGKQCKPLNLNEPILNDTDYFYFTNEYMPKKEMCSFNFKDEHGDPQIGSCRFNEMTCQNFHTKDSCSKLNNWVWDSKPCNTPLKRINKVIPYNHHLLPNY